jgi:hypothetical protein
MKNFIVILFVLLFTNSYGQYSNAKDYNSGLGYNLGFSTGIGLTYRYTPSKFGVQLTFGAYDNDFSAAVTTMYIVKRNKLSKLYLYNGNNYFSKDNILLDNITWVNSLGVGIELNSEMPFSLSIMLGSAIISELQQDIRTGITGEITILYKFGKIYDEKK